MIQIKNNKIPIQTVARALQVRPNTIYKYISRNRFKKDDKSDSILGNTFAQYVAKMGKYHEQKYKFYLKLYNSLAIVN